MIEQEIFYRFELGRISSDLCTENHLYRRVAGALSGAQRFVENLSSGGVD